MLSFYMRLRKNLKTFERMPAKYNVFIQLLLYIPVQKLLEILEKSVKADFAKRLL